MASISHNWPKDRDLPQTLQALLNETVINNSFDNKDTTDQLIHTMESAYAHLYRYQKDTVPFANFHYQTRKFLQNTTYNDIQNGIGRYTEELNRLDTEDPKNEARIAELKRLIADLGEIRFGDLFLDDYRRICVEVPYDMIDMSIREQFRRSPLYRKALSLSEIAENDKIFYRIPIVIFDHKVRTDVMIQPIEKGTRITFINTKANELYTTIDAQKFHDVQVMFVENIFFHQCIINGSNLNNLRREGSIIPFSLIDFQQKMENRIRNRDGILFCTIENSKGIHTHLMECGVTTGGIGYDGNKLVMDMIAAETDHLVVTLWFCNHMHRHRYYDHQGDVPAYKLRDPSVEGGVRPAGGFFIPTEDQKPYKMPIPEDKILVMKKISSTDDPVGPYEYQPAFEAGVMMYYPNLYQITDNSMEYRDLYRVYYFYRDDSDMVYTPLCAYYAEYLKLHYNYKFTLEEIINMVYFRLDGYDKNFYLIENHGATPDGTPGVVEGTALNQFYAVFEKFLAYMDYDYMYGTPDFMDDYIGEDIPLQYKIAKMREFVRADYHTLMEYVHRQQNKTHLLHFFVNTVELRNRLRRSTRKENPHKQAAFANSYEVVDPGKVGSFKVVDNEDYNPTKEIHIDDVKIVLSTVSLGDYVMPIGLEDQYVFTFKNPSKTDVLPIKIYIDGLLTVNYTMIEVFGMEYIYIRARLIADDSYIMVEIDTEMANAQRIPVVVENEDTWIACHFLNTPGITYTMNDIVVRDTNDKVIDKSEYEILLTENDIDYSMIDKRHDRINEYGRMTDIKIRVTNGPFPREIVVVLNKMSFIKSVIATRRGYCRFDIKGLGVNPDIRLTRMYFNGRLVSPSFYKTIKQSGREYIQTRIFCQKGDEFLFEYAPYAKDILFEIEEFSQNDPFDFSDILDKPVDAEYYEFFVNGRRLGLPNLFEFGPHHCLFRGLVSKYLLAVYQKERDFEYFGYDMINLDLSENTHHYYFEPIELIENTFISEEEKNELLDIFINHVKHPDAVIKPNQDLENPVEYVVANEVMADLQIFYFEEVLPLTLGDPNKLQFLQEFISNVYPYTTAIYEQEYGGTKVIFLDPNITVRVHDPKEQVVCGESKIACNKCNTCPKMSRDITLYQTLFDKASTFFTEELPANLVAAKYPGATLSTYKDSTKTQTAVDRLLAEMESLLKYVQDYRVISAITDYIKIKKCAVRCNKKLKTVITALDGLGIHLSSDTTKEYTVFTDAVINLDPIGTNNYKKLAEVVVNFVSGKNADCTEFIDYLRDMNDSIDDISNTVIITNTPTTSMPLSQILGYMDTIGRQLDDINGEIITSAGESVSLAEYRCANDNYPYIDGGEGVYDIISTGDIDIPKSTVLLLGEEDYYNLLLKEGQINPPKPDLYATEFTKRVYDIPNIYIQGLE